MTSFDVTEPATMEALCEALASAGVEGLEIISPDGHLRIIIETGSRPLVSHAAPMSSADTIVVKAPIAGHFRPTPDQRQEAQEVTAGGLLGFVAVGPVLVPLFSPRAGIVLRRLAAPDTLIGFATPLFELQKSP